MSGEAKKRYKKKYRVRYAKDAPKDENAHVNTSIEEFCYVIGEYVKWAKRTRKPVRNPIVGEEMGRRQIEMCRNCMNMRSVTDRKNTCETCPGVSGWMKGHEPHGWKT